jgi:type IV secretion system protein VirB4
LFQVSSVISKKLNQAMSLPNLNALISSQKNLPKVMYHVTENFVTTEDGRLLTTLKFQGLTFESTDDLVLDSEYDQLNNALLVPSRTAGKRLSYYTHLDHYQTNFFADYKFNSNWVQSFSDRYMSRFKDSDIFANQFYLTIILKPRDEDELSESIRELAEIKASILQNLNKYEPEVLSTYETSAGLFSQVYEFFGYLYNGFLEAIPVTASPFYQTIASSTLHFHYDYLEQRLPNHEVRYSTLYDLKDFPDPTVRGRFNPILNQGYPFIVTQSFNFIVVEKAIKRIDSQINKMRSVRNAAEHQIDEMNDARGYASSGELAFGSYHAALMVFGKTPRKALENGATARTAFSSACATLWNLATRSAPETFFSQFPGNTKCRPRQLVKTTRNLSGTASMNTFATGKERGNPIGDGTAVIPLKTTGNGIFHFNFHSTLPDIDTVGEKVAGHTTIIGATGTGKTTLQTALIAHLDRFNNKLFAIDKDGSMRIFIEAINGTYFTLRSGEPTGLNPFHLPDTAFNRNFLYDLVAACGRVSNDDLTAEETAQIKQAVDGVYQLPFESRRFSMVLQSIPESHGDTNNLKRRLEKWCVGSEGDVGRFAYALDNHKNNFDWENFWRVGFDVSEFLVADHPATEPILSYLFHLKTLMQRDNNDGLGAGGLLVTVVEEFWLPLKFKTTSAQILDILKTGRRRDEFCILVTQSPEDILGSPILPAVLQQTPTQIFLPNPSAHYNKRDNTGYALFNLTQKEFDKLKALGTQSRKFLVKQSGQSVIASLDLNGMGEDIAVLAGAAEDFTYLEEAQAQVGKKPEDWIPLYQNLRKNPKKLIQK